MVVINNILKWVKGLAVDQFKILFVVYVMME
jgi:hypothetical protein